MVACDQLSGGNVAVKPFGATTARDRVWDRRDKVEGECGSSSYDRGRK